MIQSNNNSNYLLSDGSVITVDTVKFSEFVKMIPLNKSCNDSRAYLHCCDCPLLATCDTMPESQKAFADIKEVESPADIGDIGDEISNLVTLVHENSKAHGWWDGEIRRPLEIHALITSEIAEATEAVRNGEPDSWRRESDGKPEGELIELVDALLRIFDYAGYRKWDLKAAIMEKHAYNVGRPYKHGKKL